MLSAGFGETGEEGKAAEQKMLEIAKRGGFVLIGPNCSGFHAKRYKGKFTGPVPDLKGERIDVISGSGATVDFIV